MSYKNANVELKGRIRIPYDDEGGAKSDESDDDDDDDMWLDYSSDSGGRVRSKKPKLINVSIISENGKKQACKGKFPLTHMYWTVRVKVNKTWLQAPPAYFIEQDNGMKQYYVSLFLDDCVKAFPPEVKDPLKACFEIFCRENLGGGPLTFLNLESTLKNYVASEGETCSLVKYPGYSDIGRWAPDNHGAHITSAVFKSGLGCTVLRAVSHPQLVECVSKLLPFAFQDYLCKLHPSKLNMAQTMAVSSPWEYCFRQILYTKLKLSGAEAYLSNYEKAGYMPVTPLREKDALHIYEVLKVDAVRDGHMFMPFCKLKTYYYFNKLGYKIAGGERWKEALDYLEESKVIVREEFNQDVNVFLHHNWKAEVDTVKGFETVLTQYEPDVDDMDVDFDSPDFDKIRGDRDQLKASRHISRLPIVVLSGMGGCGKTTVVTNLLKHVCDRHEKSLAKLKEVELSQQLEDTVIQEAEPQAQNTKCEDEQTSLSNPTTRTESALKDGSGEEEENENEERDIEEDVSRIVESKEGRLRRELKEDLLKILKDKKDTDSEEMERFKQQILLVAPTGKAARLLGCKARLPSATIHSVVMSWRNWQSPKEDQEVKEWTYSHVKILVIDECSLLSVRLFAAIVSILLEYANLSKLILLGDIKQLPSIEPGDFLRDIFRTFSKPSFGFSIELTQNHRSESTLIVENAKRISKHLLPTFDPEQRFHFIGLEENGEDNERDQTIINLLRHNQDVQCHVQSQFVSFRNAHCRAINELCCKFYNKHSVLTKTNKSKEMFHFEPGDKICLGKNHKVINHVKHLNEYIQEIQHLLNDDDGLKQSSKHIGKLGSWSKESDLNATNVGLSAAEVTSLFTGEDGDLDQTVNDLHQREVEAASRREERRARAAQRKKEWKEKHHSGQTNQETGEREKKKNSPSEEKLCNGEVFFIMDEKQIQSSDGRMTKYLILSDRDPTLPRVVCVAEKSLRKDCKMKHSWVRTIHTYQGSESDTVVYFLGPAAPQNWQHVYTAVTRGKKAVYIIGKMSQLRIAVERRSMPRFSRLRQRLDDMLVNHTQNMEKVKADRLSTSKCSDPDKSLSLSYESSDDSWISSMPDPYFTQAMNDTDVSHPSTSNIKEEEGEVVDVVTGLNRNDRPTKAITLKHSKVLCKNPNGKVNSLVNEDFVEDFSIANFSDSDNETDNHVDQRVPILNSCEYSPIRGDTGGSNKPTQSKLLTLKSSSEGTQEDSSNSQQNRAVKNSTHSPHKNFFTTSSSSKTPKKTPPRSSSSFHTIQSPCKQARLNEVSVDTPFRDNFKSTLSLDFCDEEIEENELTEDPIPSTPRDKVKRKLL